MTDWIHSDTLHSRCLLQFQGGLYSELMTRLGLGGCSSQQVKRRTLFWIVAIWLPPLALAGIGRFVSPDPPQLDIFTDLSFHVRCLVAVPLLIAFECRIQREFCDIVPAIISRKMFRPDRTSILRKVGDQLRILQTAPAVDPLLLLAGFVMVFSRLYLDLPSGTYSWKTAQSPPYVLARMWNQWFSLTFYYFFAFRWIWRFFLWSYFLFRLALLNPKLKSLHPDRVGGLAFLLRFHKMFGLASMAISSVVSANIAISVLHGRLAVDAFLDPLLLYILIFNVALALPLYVFTPVLVKSRNRGLLRYARLGNSYADDFDRKWLAHKSEATKQTMEPVLGTPDIQALNDLHGSYRSQVQMRISLMDVRTLMVDTFFLMTPLVPLLFLKFPMLELMRIITKHFFKI